MKGVGGQIAVYQLKLIRYECDIYSYLAFLIFDIDVDVTLMNHMVTSSLKA